MSDLTPTALALRIPFVSPFSAIPCFFFFILHLSYFFLHALEPDV